MATERRISCLTLLLLVPLLGGCGGAAGARGGASRGSATLLNVSYDPTREFYQEFNAAFAAYWQEKTGQQVIIEQSHGGSGKQARSVIDGLEADVVTLALAYDIQAIATYGDLLEEDWQQQFPHHSAPYTSTIVFLVRHGNPKGIHDWDDLLRDDVAIIAPNPKTSGGARWVYLAAWGYALKQSLGDLKVLQSGSHTDEIAKAQENARQFVSQLYRHVPVLDSGARGATNTFVQREIGDVLLTWENEAYLAVRELGAHKVEIVVPSVSILAEPPVAVVTRVARKHGTQAVARAYLQYLYSSEGQQLAARHYYRPTVTQPSSAELQPQFAQLELFTIDDVFGGWQYAQSRHFADGGVFDQIYQPGYTHR